MVYCTKERVLRNPLRWLQLIERFRITHSWAPNFAYALVSSALDGAAGETWDLSCMKSLLTAGEAVSSETLQEFLTRLSRFGLASSAVRPAFGMAEMGSGITYFCPSAAQPFAALSVDRRSLTGTLQPVPPIIHVASRSPRSERS
jgi:myxalamid-type polyketide synthase MxaB